MNNSPDTPEKDPACNAPKPSGNQGCIRIFCVVLALMFVLSVGSWLISASLISRKSKLSAQQVKATIASITERGEPVETAELDAFYVLPTGTSNTHHSWIAACDRFNSSEFFEETKTLPVVGVVGYPPPVRAEKWNLHEFDRVSALLEKYDECLALIHDAASKGGYARFDHQFDLGFDMPIPYVQNLRQCSRVLKLETYASLHRGDTSAGVKSLSSMFVVGRALEFEPIVYSQTEQYALDALAIELLIELLPQIEWTDAQLAQLQRRLQIPDYRSGIYRALVGERVKAIQVFRDPQPLAVALHNTEGDSNPFAITNKVLRHEDLAFYVELMTEMISGLDGTWTKAIDTSSDVMARMQQKVSKDSLTYFVTDLIFPDLEIYCDAAATADARRKLAEALIAVERYRLKHRSYPATLSEVTPVYLIDVPLDPFDNQPIRYKLHHGSPVVWSVYSNRVDDACRRTEQEGLDLVLSNCPRIVPTTR